MPWFDELVTKHGPAAPETFTHIPDDLDALQKDIETFLKGKGLPARSKIKKKLSEPGVVLVLGDPAPAKAKGYASAAVLNGAVPKDKKKFIAGFEKFVEAQTKLKKPQPDRIVLEEGSLEDFFLGCEARCNVPTSIWLNAHNKVTKTTGGNLIHEIFHSYEGGQDEANVDDFGQKLDEGFTEYFTRDFSMQVTKWSKVHQPLRAYNGPVSTITDLAAALGGPEPLYKLWFKREPKWVAALQPFQKMTQEKLKFDGNRKNNVAAPDIEKMAQAIKKAMGL